MNHGIVLHDTAFSAALDGRLERLSIPINKKHIKAGTDWDNNPNLNTHLAPYVSGDLLYIKEPYKNITASLHCCESGEVCCHRGFLFKSGRMRFPDGFDPTCNDGCLTFVEENSSVWQPARTLPPEGAWLWFKFVEVEIWRADKISETMAFEEGFEHLRTDEGRVFCFAGEVFKNWWNVNYNAHPFAWSFVLKAVAAPKIDRPELIGRTNRPRF